MNPSRISLLLCAVGVFAAVARPCLAQDVTLPDAPPKGVSAIAWRQVPAGRGISGVVVRLDSLVPLPDAVVRIADSTGAQVWQATARPAGRVTCHAVAPGRYTIRIVRLGYALARAQVEVLGTGGIAFTAVLAPQPTERIE